MVKSAWDDLIEKGVEHFRLFGEEGKRRFYYDARILPKCDLSTPAAREPREIQFKSLVICPPEWGKRTQSVRTFTTCAAVQEKAARDRVFQKDLLRAISHYFNDDLVQAHPDCRCCFEHCTNKLFSFSPYYFGSTDATHVIALSYPTCIEPEHMVYVDSLAEKEGPKARKLFNNQLNEVQPQAGWKVAPEIKKSRVDRCENCLEGWRRHQIEKLKKCARCESVCYCSKDCQKAHWKHHKHYCFPPRPTTGS